MWIRYCANASCQPLVPDMVGIGQRVLCHGATEAHVVELVGLTTQKGLDIA